MPINFNTKAQFDLGGTANYFGTSSSGYTTKPLVAFSAEGAHAAGAGNIVFPTTIFNIGNCYNTANGRFTAPMNAVYYFVGHHLGNALAGEYRIAFYVNGGTYYTGCIHIHYAETAQYASFFVSSFIYLSVNDYVNLYYVTGPGLAWPGASGHKQFSGYQVG
jgi:hypothetical protein